MSEGKKTQGAQRRVQGQGRAGSGAWGEDGDGDRAGVRRASGAGGPMEEGDSGERRRPVRRQARPEAGGREQPGGQAVQRDRQAEDAGRLAQKKAWGMSPVERARWIEREDKMPLTMQCELAGVPRSTVYRQPAYGGLLVRSRELRQSETRAAPDAGNGLGGHGAGTFHEQATPAAQGLSLPAARGGGHAA